MIKFPSKLQSEIYHTENKMEKFILGLANGLNPNNCDYSKEKFLDEHCSVNNMGRCLEG